MAEPTPATPSPLLIQSLEKGLAVLAAFRQAESMTLQEIARHCGITMGSAQRVAYTLEHSGYLRKEPRTKRYRVTVKALELGYNYLYHQPLLQQAHAVMHQLNQECGEIVNLGVPDGDQIVFVMRVAPSKHIPIYMPVGTRIPVWSSASGRAVLSFLDDAALTQKLAHAHIEKHTPRTTTDLGVLRGMIEQARHDHFAYADEEFYTADVNVSAAIVDATGEPIGAINISVPKPTWTLARACNELGPLVVHAARAIGRHAGR